MFQFTHPGGVRQDFAVGVAVVFEFQFTHPGGVRQEDGYPPTHYLKFQFTHPGGVRPPRAGRVSILV